MKRRKFLGCLSLATVLNGFNFKKPSKYIVYYIDNKLELKIFCCDNLFSDKKIFDFVSPAALAINESEFVLFWKPVPEKQLQRVCIGNVNNIRFDIETKTIGRDLYFAIVLVSDQRIVISQYHQDLQKLSNIKLELEKKILRMD